MILSVHGFVCKNTSKGPGADQRLKKSSERGLEFLAKCTLFSQLALLAILDFLV